MSADILLCVPMDQYPNRIRELRLQRGLTQDQLADKINCSKMQISGLERGKPKLDIEWMRRISAGLGCNPADLLNREDNPWQLSDAERELLARFRAADADRQADLSNVAGALVPLRLVEREAG